MSAPRLLLESENGDGDRIYVPAAEADILAQPCVVAALRKAREEERKDLYTKLAQLFRLTGEAANTVEGKNIAAVLEGTMLGLSVHGTKIE